MAGTLPAICLEGSVPVPSGIFVRLDDGTVMPPHVLPTPRIDGIVQVHLGGDAVGASRAIDALRRHHPATVARMAATLRPDLAASVDGDAALALVRSSRVYLDLPGRTDLLGAGDDRFLPIDARGGATDPAAATGVRVIPENHLVGDLPPGTAMAGAPPFPAMGGQLRLTPDSAEIGMPHGVVASRPARTAEAPTGLADPLTVRTYAELVSLLDGLATGQRAQITVTGAGGTRTVVATMGEIGLELPVTLPRRPESITVSLPVPATAAAFGNLVRRIPAPSAEDVAACVTGMRALARDLYPLGVRPAGTVEDPGTLTRTADPLPNPFASVPDSAWTRVQSWDQIRAELSRGSGQTAFVLIGRPGSFGHAVTARLVGDTLRYADFTAGRPAQLADDHTGLPALVDARALLVDSGGRTVTAPGSLQSESPAAVLTDAPGVGAEGQRYAGKKGRSSSDEALQPSKRKKSYKDQVKEQTLALFEERLPVSVLNQLGHSGAQVRERYPRSFDNEMGRSLHHISVAVANFMQSRGFKHDNEVQTMLINGRLVISANDSGSLANIFDKYQRSKQDLNNFLDLVDVPVERPKNFAPGDQANLQSRLDDAMTKSFSRKNDVLEVIRGAAAEVKVRLVDLGSSSLFRYLTDDDYYYGIILLTHSSHEALHAEQALGRAALMLMHSDINERQIYGSFSAHGRYRPCTGCGMVLNLVAETHQAVHDRLSRMSSDYDRNAFEALDYNQNPGFGYKNSLKTALSSPGMIIEDENPLGIRDAVARLTTVLNRMVSVPSSRDARPQADARTGYAPHGGLERLVDSNNVAIYNFETDSGSDADGNPRELTEDLATVRHRGQRGAPVKIRHDLSTDPEAQQLKALYEYYVQNRIGDNQSAPAGMIRLAKRVHGKYENKTELREFLGTVQFKKWVNEKDGWETKDIKPFLTRARLAALTSELEAAKPSWWSDGKLRTSSNVVNRSDTGELRDVLRRLKGFGASDQRIAGLLGMSSVATVFKHIGLIEPAEARADRETLARREVPPIRIPGWVPPTTQTPSASMTLPVRPAAVFADPAREKAFTRQLTQPVAIVDNYQWFSAGQGMYVRYDENNVQRKATADIVVRIQRLVAANRASAPTQPTTTASSSSTAAGPGHYTAPSWRRMPELGDFRYYDSTLQTQVRAIPGEYARFQFLDVASNTWKMKSYNRDTLQWETVTGQQHDVPASALVPFTGTEARMTRPHDMLAIVDAPGMAFSEKLHNVRLPAGVFGIVGHGLRAGQATAGGIAHADGTFLTVDHILDAIPPGTRWAAILSCNAYSSGLLKSLHTRNTDIGFIGPDTDLYSATTSGDSTTPTPMFTGRTVVVNGVPKIQLTGDNQLKQYDPGSAVDAEPRDIGYVLPGTLRPTEADLEAAGLAARESVAEFSRLLERVPAPSVEDPAACVTGMRGLARELHPLGVRPSGTVEDPGTEAGTLTRTTEPLLNPFASIPDSAWTRVQSWDQIRGELAGGVGHTAFVLIGRPGSVGHAVTARLADGKLWFADFQAGRTAQLADDHTGLPALVDARALLVNSDGRTLVGPGSLQSASPAAVLTDTSGVGADGQRYAGKRDAEASSAKSKRTRAGVPDTLEGEIRALFDASAPKAPIAWYGQTPDMIRKRYPRSFQPTATDPNARIGRALYYVATAFQNKTRALGVTGDYEAQVMMINDRLVIATNDSATVVTFRTKLIAAGKTFMEFVDIPSQETGYSGGDRQEKAYRLGNSISKTLKSIAGGRESNAVTDILANVDQLVVADTTWTAAELRQVLTGQSYRNSIIFLQHTDLKAIHAEQALARAVVGADLTSADIHGYYGIHGRMHPCGGCAMVMDYLHERHENDHRARGSSPTSRFQSFHSNPNPGAFYAGALHTALRTPGIVPGPDNPLGITGPAARAQRIIARGVSYPAFSFEQPAPDAFQGPGPTFGMEARRSQADATVYNLQTPSDSDSDGGARRLTTDTVIKMKTRGQGDAAGPPVRMDLTQDPDAVALKALVAYWRQHRLEDNSPVPPGFRRLVRNLYTKTQSMREVAELVSGDLNETSVQKYIKAGPGWETDDIKPMLTKELVAELGRRLQAAMPESWRNDPKNRRWATLKTQAGMLQVLAQMKGYEISASLIKSYLGVSSLTTVQRWLGGITTITPPELAADHATLAAGRVPPLRTPGVQQATATPAPVASSSTMTLPVRPAPPARTYQATTTSATTTSGTVQLARTYATTTTTPATTTPATTTPATTTPATTTPATTAGPRHYVADRWIPRPDMGENMYLDPELNRFVQSLATDPPSYRISDGETWAVQVLDPARNVWVTSKGKHLAAPSRSLVPFTGGSPLTTPLAGNTGAIVDSLGFDLSRDFADVRLPAGVFGVIGHGLSSRQVSSGGIAYAGDAFLSVDQILAVIPPGTRWAAILSCEAVDSGLLKNLHIRRPELGLYGPRNRLFGVTTAGGAKAGPLFTGEPVFVDGIPRIALSGANQLMGYQPGSAVDAEPVAMGYVVPGTPEPTGADLYAAGAIADPDWLRNSLGLLEKPFEDTPNLLSDQAVLGRRAARPPNDLRAVALRQPDEYFIWISTVRDGALDRPVFDWLNERLEQLAGAARTPVVVTRGAPVATGANRNLRALLAKYGAAVMFEVPTSSGGLGGLNLDNSWKVSGSTPATANEPDTNATWTRLNEVVVAAARRLARPTAAVRPVSEAFGALVWGARSVREQFEFLRSRPADLLDPASLDQAARMAERVPGSMKVALVKPLQAFGPDDDVVVRFTESRPIEQPETLLTAVGRLDAAGKLKDPQADGGATADFVDLVQAVRLGAPETEVPRFDFAVSLLKAVGQVKAGRFDDAERFIAENRGRLEPEQKSKWVDALNGLKDGMAEVTERHSLDRVLAAVYEC